MPAIFVVSEVKGNVREENAPDVGLNSDIVRSWFSMFTRDPVATINRGTFVSPLCVNAELSPFVVVRMALLVCGASSMRSLFERVTEVTNEFGDVCETSATCSGEAISLTLCNF